MDDHEHVVQLLHTRNAVDQEISRIIQRPMSTGHLGEWLASRIFGIDLHPSATHTGSDGVFADGPQAGRTVNIKWYSKRENLLDISTVGPPDTYLVMTGPPSAAASSRGALRPLCVENVYLFDHDEVVAALTARGTKIGIASSLVKAQWTAAEVFPAASPRLPLSDEQKHALILLRSSSGEDSVADALAVVKLPQR